MLQFSLLGSGSAGNALFIRTPRRKILIDNGLSYRQLRLRIARIGQTLEGLDGVFVTHEHGDHVHGLGTLARKLHVPVYATEKTFEALPLHVGKLPRVHRFDSGDSIELDELCLTSFSVMHDAVDPVSYTVRHGEMQLGIAMDLGRATQLVMERLKRSNALILESNYCHERIRTSPYPPSIVQRIKSSYGHLSNADMCGLLNKLLHDDLRVVVAVHVSKENNCPDTAERMARGALGNHPAHLFVSRQDEPTPLFTLGQTAHTAVSAG